MASILIFSECATAKEARLIHKGDVRQLYEDTRDRHFMHIAHPVRDPIAAVGAVPMSIAAGVTKVGNAIAGLFSDQPAVPLQDGGLAYLSRDMKSIGTNAGAAVRNAVTLHPFRALGNVVKLGFDLVDLPFDAALDVGSGIVGHQHNATRHSIGRTLAA